MARAHRQRGSIEELPSGAFRVRVHAGIDPLTRRPHYLRETVPAGPQARREAERVRTRLLAQVDEHKNPKTRATLNQLLDRWLEVLDVEASTRQGYQRKIGKHVRPLLGRMQIAKLDAELLESFYAELRKCRDHCRGQRCVQHRTTREHVCDEHDGPSCRPPRPEECRACRRACKPHTCKGLADSSIRQIHWILSGALDRAVRWGWIGVNPADQTDPPALPHPDPQPPSAQEAARILAEASRDLDWAAYVWTAMTTGARRGEMCALHWSPTVSRGKEQMSTVDLESSVVTIRRALYKDVDGDWKEKDTKTHQQRRVVLDPETVEVLREHRQRCEERAQALGIELDGGAYVFSPVPDGSLPLVPDSVTQRYDRMTARLGIRTSLKNLRHYSATELIAGGVDVRTVAGRLGHAGGGATTLRVYTAWVSESDQRAAGNLAARMPRRQKSPSTPQAEVTAFEPSNPYEQVAVSLRDRILDGSLAGGQPIPQVKQLACEHGVSVGTAQRAVALLEDWGLVDVMPGRRTLVRRFINTDGHSDVETVRLAEEVGLEEKAASEEKVDVTVATPSLPEPLDLEIWRLGKVISRVRAVAAVIDHDALGRLLAAAVKRDGRPLSEIDTYEMVVRRAGEQDALMTFVAAPE